MVDRREDFRQSHARDERGGTKLAAAAVGTVCCGLALLGSIHAGVEATPTVHDATNKAKIVDWEEMSKILAAEGTFIDTANADVNVHMDYNLPGSGIMGVGSVVGFFSDKLAPDYSETMKVQCAGKLQEIVPVSAVKQEVDGSKLHLAIDMSKIEINPYCVDSSADVDPSTSKSLYAGLIILRDGLSKVGKTLHIVDDNTLPKPDVLMEDVTDNSKSALESESVQSMVKTCGPKLNNIAKESAIQGVRKTVLGLTDIKPGNLEVVASYENGRIKWTVPKDEQISKIAQKFVSMEPTVKGFDFDQESCDTADMQVIGGGAKNQ